MAERVCACLCAAVNGVGGREKTEEETRGEEWGWKGGGAERQEDLGC